MRCGFGNLYLRHFQNISVALRPLVEPIFKPIAGFSLPDKEVMDAPYEFYEQIGNQVESVANALRELEALRQDGLISEYEFEQKRRQMLDQI